MPLFGKRKRAEEPSSTMATSSDRDFTLKAVGSEAAAYDYVAARTQLGYKTTNAFESVGNLIKSCLGAGITAIHVGYADCGLWTALVLNFFLGLIISYAMYILVKSAQKTYGRIQTPTLSYPDLAEASLAICPFPKIRKYSKVLRYLVDITIGIDLFGSCCCYQIVIAKSFVSIMADVKMADSCPSVRVILAILVIPCILISMILTLKYLAPLSIVANAFILLVVFSCIGFAIKNRHEKQVETQPVKDFEGIMKFIGVCIFSMEGVGVTLPIENSMAVPRKMPTVLTFGMIVVCALVMLSGFFGYWGFGNDPEEPVTNAFPSNGYTTALKVVMMFMIWVTFALNFWVPFNLVWVYLKRRFKKNLKFWERVVRAIFVIIITLISIAFPNITHLMGLIGAVCLSNMGFIYPAFIELMLDWEKPGLGYLKWRLWKCIAICGFGLFVLILSAYFNGKALINATLF